MIGAATAVALGEGAVDGEIDGDPGPPAQPVTTIGADGHEGDGSL